MGTWTGLELAISTKTRLLGAVSAVVAAAVLAGVVYAVSDGTGSSAGRSSSDLATGAGSPAGLAVYPLANTRTASPQTSISLRGMHTESIGRISVRGSSSGEHTGRFSADSDGNGESFYPSKPFAPGERVTVTAQHPLVGSTAATHDSITFTVSRPVADPPGRSGTETNNPAEETHFVSAPQLQAPIVRVVKGSLDPSSGDLFLAPRGGAGGDGPLIAQPDGSPVWYKPVPPGLQIYDFRAQTYRSKPVLTWYQGHPADMHGRGVDVIYDSSYHQIATVRAGNGYAADHHDFQLTGWNTALITAYQPVRWDLRSVGGSADGIVTDGIFQEIDIATGNVLAEWHTLDHVALADSFRPLPRPGIQWDYFHINSVDSRRPGEVMVSARMTHTIYDVQEATGRVLWQLGGKHSTFTGNATDFSSQHDAKFLDATHISVFDNGGGVGPTIHQHSRAVVARLDFAHRTATLVTDDQGLDFPFAPTQGNTQVLPNGDVFVGWAGRVYASEFNKAGREIYRSELLDHHNETYREYLLPWHAHPTTVPSVVASKSGARMKVWVSWNGATDVAGWRVLTGATSARVTTPAGSYARSSFETAITVNGTPAYLAVQALRSDASVLASSSAVAVKKG